MYCRMKHQAVLRRYTFDNSYKYIIYVNILDINMLYIYIYIYMLYIHTHTHIHTHIYIHIYIYIYIYICLIYLYLIYLHILDMYIYIYIYIYQTSDSLLKFIIHFFSFNIKCHTLSSSIIVLLYNSCILILYQTASVRQMLRHITHGFANTKFKYLGNKKSF